MRVSPPNRSPVHRLLLGAEHSLASRTAAPRAFELLAARLASVSAKIAVGFSHNV
jgi:hypothetical protein